MRITAVVATLQSVGRSDSACSVTWQAEIGAVRLLTSLCPFARLPATGIAPPCYEMGYSEWVLHGTARYGTARPADSRQSLLTGRSLWSPTARGLRSSAGGGGGGAPPLPARSTAGRWPWSGAAPELQIVFLLRLDDAVYRRRRRPRSLSAVPVLCTVPGLRRPGAPSLRGQAVSLPGGGDGQASSLADRPGAAAWRRRDFRVPGEVCTLTGSGVRSRRAIDGCFRAAVVLL